MFNQNEIQEWEHNFDSYKMQQLYPNQKKYKCPRYKRMKNYRHSDKYFSWGKESPSQKKMCRRQYRSTCKHLMDRQNYDALVKPIGTQGWLTW